MALPTRNEVSDDLKWDLSRVFKNDQEWEQEYNHVAKEIKNLNKFKGMLAKSGKNLYKGITEILAVNRRLEKCMFTLQCQVMSIPKIITTLVL